MKLYILAEDHSVDPEFEAEYGLSMYVEKDGFKLLFDLASRDAFIRNAATFGLDLTKLSAIAFSHNHYDHCGGFIKFAKKYHPSCPVYAHTGFFRRKWWDHNLDPVDSETYEEAQQLVGPPMTPEFFIQEGLRFRMLPGDVFELAPDIYLLGNFPQERGEETPHPSSTMEIDANTFVQDEFRDEQVCVIREKQGLIVLTGCAHNGIMNILNTVEQRFPGETIYAIFGGTHLVQSEDPRVRHTIDYINNRDLTIAGVCHCTGPRGLEAFKASVPNYVEVGAGSTWDSEE